MAGESKDLERMLGDPKGAIRSMLLPLIVSYLVVQINLFADTSWCSGLGADASSAVSTISPFYWIVSGLGTGLGIGAATAIARYLGRGEKHNADRLASQTVVLSVIIGIISTPVLLLAVDPALSMMGAQDIAEECREYILRRSWRAPSSSWTGQFLESSGRRGPPRGPWSCCWSRRRSTWSSTLC